MTMIRISFDVGSVEAVIESTGGGTEWAVFDLFRGGKLMNPICGKSKSRHMRSFAMRT